MSSTRNSQNLLTNVFRPAYTYDGSSFQVALVASNITTVDATKLRSGIVEIGDAGSNVFLGCNAGVPYNPALNVSNNVGLGVSAAAGISNVQDSVFIGRNAGALLCNATDTAVIGTNDVVVGTANTVIGNRNRVFGDNNLVIGRDLCENSSYRLNIGGLIKGDISQNGNLEFTTNVVILGTLQCTAFDASGLATTNVVVPGYIRNSANPTGWIMDISQGNFSFTGTGVSRVSDVSFYRGRIDASAGIFGTGFDLSSGLTLTGTISNSGNTTSSNFITPTASSNSVGGVTLSNSNITYAGKITGTTDATSNRIGGVDLSGNNISNSGTHFASNFFGTSTASNNIGGVTLSNTNISYAGRITGTTDATSNRIGGVDLSGNNISNSGTHFASNFFGTSTASNNIGGVTLSNTNISYAGRITGTTDATSNRIGGVDLSGTNISNAGTHFASNFFGTSSASNNIGGVTLSNTNISYAGRITGTTDATSNRIGGVDLSGTNISNAGTTRSSNFIGTSTASNQIGGVTLSNTNITYTGTIIGSTDNTSNKIGGVTLNNGILRSDPSDTFMVATGSGTNTFAVSVDGSSWVARGSPILTSYGTFAAWNGSYWLACGNGSTFKLAYSTDGSNWGGVVSPFGTATNAAAWNGSLWVVVGSGTNTIATSMDASSWTGRGTGTFSSSGNGVAWNGSIWVAVGQGTNTLATSIDGSSWITQTSTFSTAGNGIAWNGKIWVAVGQGTHGIAWSSNGSNWTGLGTSIFTTGTSVAWNGSLWVATGQGANTIATSPDGIVWTGRGTSTFTNYGSGIAWNGTYWVATGTGGNTLANSVDGINWVPLSSPFTTSGIGIASRRYVLPVINTVQNILSNGSVQFTGAIIGSNSATSNQIGGTTLSNGSVGIGTTAPATSLGYLLDICGGGIHVRTPAPAGTGLTVLQTFANSAYAGTTDASARRFAFAYSNAEVDPGTGGDLNLMTYSNNGTGGKSVMTVQRGGNIGIGTTAPAYTLDVSGIDNTVRVIGQTYPTIYVQSRQNDTSFGSLVYDGTSANNKFIIRTSTGTPVTFEIPGNTERMRIAANGNVGIGTTNPTVKLTVVGDISTNGAITGTNNSASNRIGGVVLCNGYMMTGGSGSAANPAMTFCNDMTSGIYSSGTSTVAIATAGVSRMNVAADGVITMIDANSFRFENNGGNYPRMSLNGGNSRLFLYSAFSGLGDGGHMGYNAYYPNGGPAWVVNNTSAGTSRISAGYGFVGIYTGDTNQAPTTLGYYQNSNGRVGIGTTTPSHTLDVNGTIRGSSNIVAVATTSNWVNTETAANDTSLTIIYTPKQSGTVTLLVNASVEAYFKGGTGSDSIALNIRNNATVLGAIETTWDGNAVSGRNVQNYFTGGRFVTTTVTGATPINVRIFRSSGDDTAYVKNGYLSIYELSTT